MISVSEMALAVKAELDKVRADVDAATKAAVEFKSSILGEILQSVPKAGPLITLLIEGIEAADKCVDAIDTIVDQTAAPTPVPPSKK